MLCVAKAAITRSAVGFLSLAGAHMFLLVGTVKSGHAYTAMLVRVRLLSTCANTTVMLTVVVR